MPGNAPDRPPRLERASQAATIGNFAVAFAVLALGGAAGFVGGRAATSDQTSTETKKETTTETTTVTAPTRPGPQIAAQTGLGALADAGRVDSAEGVGVVGDVVRISPLARAQPDGAITQVGTAYSTATIVVTTANEFQRMTGIVGIDAGADCAQNDALVFVTDQEGRLLWPQSGQQQVSSEHAVRVSADIAGASQVKLVTQALTQFSGPCSGFTEVDWGRVVFLG
jgi:hypothetical protein